MPFHLFASGRGFLVPIITFACCFAMELLVPGDNSTTSVTIGRMAGLFSSLSSHPGCSSMCLLRGAVERRELRDVSTGELITVDYDHRFLFIHVRYWPALLCALGAVFAALALRGLL